MRGDRRKCLLVSYVDWSNTANLTFDVSFPIVAHSRSIIVRTNHVRSIAAVRNLLKAREIGAVELAVEISS